MLAEILLSALCAAIAEASSHQNHIPVEVETKLGKIRGQESIFLHKRVRSFLSVPFAEPPLDEQRFRPPKPKKPWNDTITANTLSPACYQGRDMYNSSFWGSEMWNHNTPVSEDCLFLNIWTPAEAYNLTVMVWLFGGGYYSGSPSLILYDGKALALLGNVIVVNVNYRVGPFGYLFMDDDEAPGNVGMLDQASSHQNHIPVEVETKLGKIRGQESIFLHKRVRSFLSVPFAEPPLEEQRFRPPKPKKPWNDTITANTLSPACYQGRDMYNSSFWGSEMWNHNTPVSEDCLFLNIWTPAEAYNLTVMVWLFGGGYYSGSPSLILYDGKIKESIACLRSVPAQLLVDNIWNLNLHFLEFPFVIVSRDRNFFRHKDGFTSLRTGQYVHHVNLMFGINHDEGNFWNIYNLAEYFDKSEQPELNRKEFHECVERAFSVQPELVRSAAKHVYSDPNCTDPNRRTQFYAEQVNQMVGDYFFTCDSIWLAAKIPRHKPKAGRVYVYYFDQPSSANPWPKWTGVMHGYEIEYVFGVPIYNETAGYTKREQILSEKIIQYWSSFATTGVPRLKDSKATDIWPEYDGVNNTR
ncbi:Carboxylesterase [Oesophagostomum dentatum]|uniref:acetylcholinesterase n=1 Tax=Oesophagostomum dentatum TaxID=61180 RepID=A0A0B1TFH3_OESDE|nr:Carboxylesterase [Oesophagostomum dentatum]